MLDKRLTDQLIDAARAAADNSYCPYSSFPVGAAVFTESGAIFSGCNVENLSFGASICAERVAVCCAISNGHTRITAIAVYHNGDELIYPCGVCLQFLSEFNKEMAVVVANDDNQIQTSLNRLLPHAFETNEL